MSDIVAGESQKLILRKPITVHGQSGPVTVNELTLNMPSGAIVMRLGEPFSTKTEQASAGAPLKVEIAIIAPVASQYLADMTGYNSDLLAKMHPRDLLDAFDMIAKMLRPIEG